MTTNPKITPDQIYKFLGIDCTVNRYADREAWKAARHGELFDRVGASELAGLFGVDGAYDSQYSLWSKRVDPDAWREEVEREAENLYWGKLIEGVIVARYAEQTGHGVFAWPQTDIVVAKDWPGFCTPDAIVVDDDGPCITECKGWNEAARKQWQDGPPLSVILQNLHQQEVTGIHRGRILALFGNQIHRLGVFNVDYHSKFADEIRERAYTFATYVRTRREPPVDESSMTAEAIYRLHPDDDGSDRDLPEESDAWAIAFEQAKADEKDAKERVDAFGNLLKASVGDATYGVTPANRWFSWKTQATGGSIDRDKLANEFPDAFAAVYKPGKCRVLRSMANPPKI